MSITPAYRSECPKIGTRLIRIDVDGDCIECDVVIYYEISHGADKRKLIFLGAEFDGSPPDETPGPLSPDEIEQLKRWLDANQAEFEDLICDDPGLDYSCWRYHQTECT